MNNAQTYWIGPYSVLVPQEVKSVVASDGVHKMYADGRETGSDNFSTMNSHSYRSKYSRYDMMRGLWFYNGPCYNEQ